MSKHTKGPWNVVERTPDRQLGRSNLQCYSVDTDEGLTVAECGAGQANARLIAAAPELLEAADRVFIECVIDVESKAAQELACIIAKAKRR